MLYIDQYVYGNKMRNSHPLERFFFAILTMGISLLANKFAVHLAIIIIMVSLLVVRAKIPGHVVTKLMLAPMVFLFLGVITIALVISTSAEGMLVSVQVGSYFLGATKDSLLLAGMTILKSFSAVSSLYFLILTTPMTEIIYVLQLLRLSATVTELMMITYRFIFVFLETAFRIYTAQSARLGFINFKISIRSFALLFANLWGKAFLKSQGLFTSLQARGYEKELKVLNQNYQFSLGNIFFFSLVELSLITLALV